MAIDPNTAIEASGGLIAALGGLYGAAKRFIKHSEAKKAKYRQDILDQAKEEAEKVKAALEAKIKALEIEFAVQKQSVSKDLNFFKQTHNAEVKALGEKIEALRQDLQQQHQALIGLLTKLVSNK